MINFKNKYKFINKRKKKLVFSSTKIRRYEKKINPCAISPIRRKPKKSIKQRLREKRGYRIKTPTILIFKATLEDIKITSFYEEWLNELVKLANEPEVSIWPKSIEGMSSVTDNRPLILNIEFTPDSAR